MADRTTITAAHLQKFILEGSVTHRFHLMGEEVVLDLFPSGTYEDIIMMASGPDERVRDYRRDVISLAHALRSIGGFDWGGKWEAKYEFVRSLHEPLQALFIEELLRARLTQREEFEKRKAELKKSSPDQS